MYTQGKVRSIACDPYVTKLRLMDSKEIQSLNDSGFFPGPNESEEGFLNRVKAMKSWSQTLENKDLELQDLPYTLQHSERMSDSQLIESGEPIKTKFGILPYWVPAYFTDKGLPLLTGGMAIQFVEEENGPLKTFFQLKSVFRTQKKWIIYSGDELIRHEMCHVARAPLNSTRYEETFAYSTSDSWLRRKIGGALNTPFDNQLVLLSLLCWMCASFLPLFFESVQSWNFVLYIPFPLVITLGLIRNFNLRNELHRANLNLKANFPKDYEKLLFRLSDDEIRQISHFTSPEVCSWWDNLNSFRGEFLKSVFFITNRPKSGT